MAGWLNANVPSRQRMKPQGAASRALFLLDRLNVSGYIVQPDVAKVTIFFNLMKDRPPNRHFPRSVGKDDVFAGNDSLHMPGGNRASR
jgi:hypothetical protein